MLLTHNSADVLARFLPRLKTLTPSSAALFLVDNASQDESLSIGSRYVQEERIIALSENKGYTGGYNEGLRRIREHHAPTYYVLINPDVLVTEHWLPPLIAWMEAHPKAAACQPGLRNHGRPDLFDFAGAAGGFIDSLGYPFCMGRVFSTLEKDVGQYEAPRRVFWASGACLVLRSTAFWSVGGFDERFFMYMEEIDLCWRLQKRGYHVYSYPSCIVYHTGKSPAQKGYDQLYFEFRNSLIMLHKHTSPRWVLLYKLPTRMLMDGIAMVFLRVQRGNWRGARSIWRAQRDFASHVRHMMGATPDRTCKKSEASIRHLIYGGSVVIDYFLLRKRKCPPLFEKHTEEDK